MELGSANPLAVVGDVHGSPSQLASALADLAAWTNRTIVCVGDYINRGPDSRGVLEVLTCARREFGDRLVLLRGNHEVALLEFLRTGRAASFLRHRGVTTIRSYVPNPGPNVLDDFRRCFPPAHRLLLEGTALFVETPEVLISHAGYSPERPKSRSEKDLTVGSWSALVADVRPPRPLIVVGHYTQPHSRAYVSDSLIGLDTGCGSLPSAPLSVLLLPERSVHAYPSPT